MPSIRGLLLVILGLAILIVETFFLIVQPIQNDDFTLTETQYWALTIPLYFIFFIIVALTIWIGYTMVTTPEPIRLTYEEAYEVALEDEAGENE